MGFGEEWDVDLSIQWVPGTSTAAVGKVDCLFLPPWRPHIGMTLCYTGTVHYHFTVGGFSRSMELCQTLGKNGTYPSQSCSRCVGILPGG
jgi:hypothetical protein